jgi:putative ABC transport system substrate-binding protein
MTRRIVVYLRPTILLLLSVYLADAQQSPAKIPRIGFLASGGPESTTIPSFRQGLRDIGYIEGKNILVEYRYMEGKEDRMPSFVAELVQLKVDVFVSTNSSAIRAAKQATKTIPIVMVITGDPVATGLIESLARPGGNVTGLTRLTRELSGKRLELLKEVFPRLSRVGILWSAASAPGVTTVYQDYETAARILKIPLHSLEVRGPKPDLAGAFQVAANGRVSALVATVATVLVPYPKKIADLAIKNRLPLMFETSRWVELGGLVSHAASDDANYRRAAVYVDKILKGAKPADLPVEQPTKFEFVINLKTAKQIGLTIPPNVLVRADKVIK